MISCALRGWRHRFGPIVTPVLVTFLLLARSLAQENHQDHEAEQQKTHLPDGPGKETFVHDCGTCHSPEVVVGKGYAADGWAQVVGVMVDKGAQVSGDHFPTIVRYLAANFPPINGKGDVIRTPTAELESFASAPVSAAKPEARPSEVKTYPGLCGSCHGGDLNGGTGPSILQFVRYHTDAEIMDVLQSKNSPFRTDDKMPIYQLPDDQMHPLLTDLRVLAGTNPTMATGGFTGYSFTYSRSGARIIVTDTNAPPFGAGSGGETPRFQPRPATLELTNGHKLAGTLMAQTESDAALLSVDGKMHLLAPEGTRYRDKPIEPKSDWLTYHGSISGNRFSVLDQINSRNVQKLSVAWKLPIPSSPRLQATPIVVDGVMYMTAWNELYALDATTGIPIWSFHQPHSNGILGEAGRGSNRGAAVSGNLVFMLTDNAHLLALDRRNGTKVWDVELGSIKDAVMASSAPLVAGDLVIVGVGGGEEGVRGFIDAYKVATGEHAWRFYTIPNRGEKAADTWIGNALEHGCGSTWMTGSYDPALKMVYWGTGNPCPDENGAERIGDNLYTCSVVALSFRTGKLIWHFQFTPHDTHDWDSTQSMILVDRKWQGQDRKLLVHGDRDGYFFVLDRTDGKLLLAQPLTSKVTWTTGYGKDGRPILTSAWESTLGGTAICPGAFGGPNWPDPSYNPLTNLFYVRVSDTCGIYTARIDPLTTGINSWGEGGIPDEKARQDLKNLTSGGYGAESFIRAVDIFTGKKVWDFSPLERSGVLSTAGGVVFIGGRGGLTALDARTGKELASVDAGVPPTVLPVFAASPMTYMVGGRQYVALSGTGVMVAYALPDYVSNSVALKEHPRAP
jgi:alcohol dehydrogenase (cytochrome c)